MKTSIPLDVLNAHIWIAFPDFSARTANCLQNAGITRTWQLLVQTESSLLKLKNFGRKSLNEVIDTLAEKNWRLGSFMPECRPLLEQIYLSTWSWILPVDVIGPDRVPPVPERDHVTHFLATFGLRANMRLDELFVYVSPRAALTVQQLEFLRMDTADVFTEKNEVAWCDSLRGGGVKQTVSQIALVLPHLRSDDVDAGTIAHIRARIEAEVGPLPLELSSTELARLLRSMQ